MRHVQAQQSVEQFTSLTALLSYVYGSQIQNCRRRRIQKLNTVTWKGLQAQAQAEHIAKEPGAPWAFHWRPNIIPQLVHDDVVSRARRLLHRLKKPGMGRMTWVLWTNCRGRVCSGAALYVADTCGSALIESLESRLDVVRLS